MNVSVIYLHNRGVEQTTSTVTQLVKNLSVMQETWVQSLGWEDTLEKGKTTHSSILAWRIPTLQADSLLFESPGKYKNTGVGSLSLL